MAYAGIYAFSKLGIVREYIQVQLKDTLKIGGKYCVSFYVNLPDVVNYAVSSMGAYLSAVPVSSSNFGRLPYVPQIANNSSNLLTSKTDWMPIQDTLVAAGGELYITIGNFKTDANSDTVRISNSNGNIDISYYLVDDVSVIPLIDSIDAGRDTSIFCGDTVTLGVETDTNYVYSWFPATGLSNTAAAQPIANPVVTTTYYLTVNPSTCSKTDSVTVTVINCDTLTANAIYIPNAFSPNGDGINDTLQVKAKGAENISYFSFTVYNRWGEEVFKTNDITKGWDGMYMNAEAPEGVYVYFYSAVLNTEEPEIKKGNVTLIR